jgi:hypothetical protein
MAEKMTNRKFHFRSFALYTTRKYIEDCVTLAREENRSAVRMKRMSRRSTVFGEAAWLARANARFELARRSMADARRAKVEG